MAAGTALQRVRAERYTGLHGRSILAAEPTSTGPTSMAAPPRGLHEHAASALALTEHCLELLLSRTRKTGAPPPPALTGPAADYLHHHVSSKKRRRTGGDVGTASTQSGDVFRAATAGSASRFLDDSRSAHAPASLPPTSHFAALDMRTMHGPSPTHSSQMLQGGGASFAQHQLAYHPAAGGGHGQPNMPPHAQAFHHPHMHQAGYRAVPSAHLYHAGGAALPAGGVIDPLAGRSGANAAPHIALGAAHGAGMAALAPSLPNSEHHLAPGSSFGFPAGSVPPHRSVLSGGSKPDGAADGASDSGHSSDSSSLASVGPSVQHDSILRTLEARLSSNLLPAGGDRGHSTSPHGQPAKPPARPRSSSGQGGLLTGIAGDTARHNVVLRPKPAGSGNTPTGVPAVRVDASPALLPTPEPPQPVPAGMAQGNQEATREALMAEVADLFAHLPSQLRSLPLSHCAAQGWRRAAKLPRKQLDIAALKGKPEAPPRRPKHGNKTRQHCRLGATSSSASVLSSPTAHSGAAPRRAASEADATELSGALAEAFTRARYQQRSPSDPSEVQLSTTRPASGLQGGELLSPTLLLLQGMVAAAAGGAPHRIKVGANPSATTRDLRRSDAAQQWAAARAAAALANRGQQQARASSGSGGVPSGTSALQLLTGTSLFPGAEALTAEVGVKLQAIAAAQGTAAQSITGGSALLGTVGGSTKRAPASVSFGRQPDGSTLSGSRV